MGVFIYQQTTAVLLKRPTSFSKSLVNRQDGGFLCATMTKEIQLTKGYKAMVDDCDYELLSKFNWQSHLSRGNVYAIRSETVGFLKRKTVLMHRFILGAVDGQQVDHENGNGLDNRRSNIRLATNSENAYNQRMRKNNTSGYKGVHKIGNKWQASIRYSGKRHTLGTFDTPEQAAKEYDKAAKEHHGIFAKTNL